MLLSMIDQSNDLVALKAFPLILKDPARRFFRKEIRSYVISVRGTCIALLSEFLKDIIIIVNDQVTMDLSLNGLMMKGTWKTGLTCSSNGQVGAKFCSVDIRERE
jgi:hypothetical protein